MKERLPFYMVYDADNFIMNQRMDRNWDDWDEEYSSRRDYEYMKSMYPDVAKRIMPYVEEECDHLEYTGSMMFDECPDQLQLQMMCRRICTRVRENDVVKDNIEEKWLQDIIKIVMWQEILKRRNEYRKYRRKFY